MDAYSPILGQIVPFAGRYAPAAWMFCNGATLPSAQNAALFSLIGSRYGGDNTNFAVPDLSGYVTCGVGTPAYAPTTNLTIGTKFGQRSMPLTTSNMPVHGHGVALTLQTGVSYTTGPGTVNVPLAGSLLAKAVKDATTPEVTVDVYAPVSGATPINVLLPVTITGTPTITSGPGGGSGTPGLSVIQPTAAMYLCICISGDYPPIP